MPRELTDRTRGASGPLATLHEVRSLKWVDTRLTFVDPSSGKVLLSVTRSGSRPISEESITRVIAWFVLGAVAGFIAEHLTGKRGGLVLATVTAAACRRWRRVRACVSPWTDDIFGDRWWG